MLNWFEFSWLFFFISYWKKSLIGFFSFCLIWILWGKAQHNKWYNTILFPFCQTQWFPWKKVALFSRLNHYYAEWLIQDNFILTWGLQLNSINAHFDVTDLSIYWFIDLFDFMFPFTPSRRVLTHQYPSYTLSHRTQYDSY